MTRLGSTPRQPSATPNGQEHALISLDDTTATPHVLDQMLRTERLQLRPAAAEDTDATWAFRRLETVNEWLTGCPADLDGYRALFTEPGRLATTVIVELSDGTIIGDFMLRREDAWAQLEVAEQAAGAQAELGWVLDPTYADAATPPKPCTRCCVTASPSSTSAESSPTASSLTTPPGA